MKYIKTFEQFVNESKANEHLNLILESFRRRGPGIVDVLLPKIGEPVKGGRADKAYWKAIEKLKAAGYTLSDSDDSTSQSSGNVNRSQTFEHDQSPNRITVRLYLGYSARDNSFTYSFDKKPMVVTIANDSDYNDKLAMLSDLDELKYIILGFKTNEMFPRFQDVEETIREYIAAELRAISNYAGKKTKPTIFSKLGNDLPNDKDFIEFVKARGCQIIKNYLGREDQIRVNYDYKMSLSPETVTNFAGITHVFNDSRVGMAYIKLNDKSDVEGLVSSLLKIPAIF